MSGVQKCALPFSSQHKLIKAYRGLRIDDFERFVGFFVEAGYDVDGKDEHGKTFAEVISDQTKFRAYSREYAEIEPVNAAFREFRKVQSDLEGAQALLKDSDPDEAAKWAEGGAWRVADCAGIPRPWRPCPCRRMPAFFQQGQSGGQAYGAVKIAE